MSRHPDASRARVDEKHSVGGGKFRLSLSLTGGDAVLFKFNDGAPFVGIDNQAFVPEPAALGMLGLMLLTFSRRRRA